MLSVLLSFLSFIGSYFTFCSILSFHPYLQTKDHYIQGYRTPRLIDWCLDWCISITLRKLIYVLTIRTQHQFENSPLTSRQNICIHLSTTETKKYPRTRKRKCVNKKGCPCPYKKGKRDNLNTEKIWIVGTNMLLALSPIGEFPINLLESKYNGS
jgi:hypothetical protein